MNQPLSATDPSPFEVTAAPPFDLPAAANPSGCPNCGFPIRQLLATASPTGGTQAETRCPSCGNRRPQIAALRSRLVAKWPGRGRWWRDE
jgi:predicted RNA-binding Zn-ribbon protein involved in translation (DUF1610 family)